MVWYCGEAYLLWISWSNVKNNFNLPCLSQQNVCSKTMNSREISHIETLSANPECHVVVCVDIKNRLLDFRDLEGRRKREKLYFWSRISNPVVNQWQDLEISG